MSEKPTYEELEQRIKVLEEAAIEAKRLQVALRESEEKFRVLADSTPTGVMLFQDDHYTYANKAAETITGYDVEELRGMPFWHFIHPEYTALIQKRGRDRQLGKETENRYECRFIRKDGSEMWADVAGASMIMGGKPAGIITMNDITDRKLAEEDSRKNRLFLSELIEYSGAIICVKDREGHYELVNRKFEEVTGWERQDVLGKTDKELFPGAVGNQFRLNDLEAMKSGAVLEKEEILEGESGKRFFISAKFPLYGDDGAVSGVCGMITEITARKLAESQRETAIDALGKSESLIRTITNSAQDAILMMNPEGCISFWNPAAERIFGYTAEEAMGCNLHQLLAPKRYLECYHRAFGRFKTNGRGYVTGKTVELRACRRNGEEVPIELSLSAIQLEDGWHALGIMRDITTRKQVEKALRKSEERYRTFINATSDMVFLKDDEFRHIVANKSLAAFFGKPEEEVVGKCDFDLMPQAAAESCRKTDLDAMTSSSIVISEEIIGDQVFESLKFPVDLGEYKKGVGGIIRNITARKHAEQVRQESERRLADIIEFLPDATLVIDKSGKVIAWNRAIETMCGIKKEDMLGRGDYEYALPFYGARRPILIDFALHPNKVIENEYTSIRRVGDILFGDAFTTNLPPGDVHLSGTASILRDEKGEIIAAIECIRDNTERKRLEERLNRAEKMEGLGRLAGGVAHDLNNVLGVLVGYSELLLAKLPGDSTLKRYAENILQSSVRGAAIVQDLLTLARRGVVVSQVIDLNRLACDYFKTPEFEKLKADHPNVKIWTELADGLLNIKGSPVHLSKTIMNLVSNAIESISGPGEVTLQTKNRYLDHPIQGYDEMKEGDYAVLTVSDTGIGISQNDLGKIFEPFYTKKVMGRSGTGLGLAVVWGTVKDHNGYIDVQSEEGKGTSITLYFPVTREAVAKSEKAASLASYMARGESILVVDDMKEQRELATGMLGSIGYQATAVAGGEEAVEYLKCKKADLILLDMIMDPGIDGMETYRRILEIRPGQKAIIVSGFSETDRVRKTMEMGAGAFVRKPYILEKIGLAIRKELDRTGS